MNEKNPSKKRRWKILGIGILILGLLVFFCLVPFPLRVDESTCGIPGPLKEDGQVDYAKAYENMYPERFENQDENGFKMLIEAFGSDVIRGTLIASDVPWEQLPDNPSYSKWFAEDWTLLCQKLSIDPHSKPKYYRAITFRNRIPVFLKAGYLYEHEQPPGDESLFNTPFTDPHTGEMIDNYSNLSAKILRKFKEKPWDAEKYPLIAEWLEDYSPLLDLYGEAVRKERFEPIPTGRPLNDYHGFTKPGFSFLEDGLSIRFYERLYRGNTEEAWRDLYSMILGKMLEENHYSRELKMLDDLFACEGISKEQLERFASEMEDRKLSPKPYDFELERLKTFEFLMLLGNSKFGERREYAREMKTLRKALFDENEIEKENAYINTGHGLAILPFDLNIAGKRLNERLKDLDEIRKRHTDSDGNIDEKTCFEERMKYASKIPPSLFSLTLKMPLIRTRSQLVADALLVESVFDIRSLIHDNEKSRFAFINMMRTMIALERFRLEKGEYPDNLDILLPDYLPEIPPNPFSENGEKIVYERKSEGESEYDLSVDFPYDKKLLFKRSR